MIYYNNIPHDQRKFIIPAHMFIKDKFKANGTFDKTKARLVVNGDRKHPDTIGETFSPTVNPISVFTQLNLTACADAELAAYDIKGAFLLTPVTDGKLIYLRIPPEVAEHWIRLYPQRAKYLAKDGCLYAHWVNICTDYQKHRMNSMSFSMANSSTWASNTLAQTAACIRSVLKTV